MTFRLYNTLTRKKEVFQPVDPPKVGMYCCGVTPYMESHIGHAVGPVIFDTLKRYLTYLDYKVTLVINVTDVEDKLIDRARELGTTVKSLAEKHTQDYCDYLRKLGVDTIDFMPRATENIDAIIRITHGLIDRGYAYVLNGDVYFDIAKDSEYGKLSGQDPEKLRTSTVLEKNPLKRNPGDFALWKAAKPGEPAWDSPWGPGRPGWHIECSAMSMRYLGETLDIHGGGLDLVFAHHENELAQSECFTGKPFARFWLHNGLLQSTDDTRKLGARPREDNSAEQDANKMSKSKGNTVTLGELLSRHQPEAVRFYLLASHYRRPIEFSENHIREVDRAMQAFYRFFVRYQEITGESFYSLRAPERRSDFVADGDQTEFLGQVKAQRDAFFDALNDDFNTAGAVAGLFEQTTILNRFADQHRLEGDGTSNPVLVTALRRGLLVFRELSAILGLFRSPITTALTPSDSLATHLVELLIEIRKEARADKNFALADGIRAQLSTLGVNLEDRNGATVWRIGKPTGERVLVGAPIGE